MGTPQLKKAKIGWAEEELKKSGIDPGWMRPRRNRRCEFNFSLNLGIKMDRMVIRRIRCVSFIVCYFLSMFSLLLFFFLLLTICMFFFQAANK